jgi:hypothetical protein
MPYKSQMQLLGFCCDCEIRIFRHSVVHCLPSAALWTEMACSGWAGLGPSMRGPQATI